MAGTNGNGNGNGGAPKVGTDTVKQGLAQMLKGGVIVSWNPSFGFARCLDTRRGSKKIKLGVDAFISTQRDIV